MALTARIIKGGALLEDSRRFLEAWDPSLDADTNLARIIGDNLMVKPSLSRAEDVVAVLRRRLLAGGPVVLEALRALSASARPFRDACLYEAARDDELLALFMGGTLFRWRQEAHRHVDADLVSDWLSTLVPGWNARTRKRVAEGLLATARDFGHLDGVVHKRIVAPGLSLPGFAYVAIRERATSGSSRALLDSPVWRRYLLDDDDVRALFHQADRHKILRFSEAGTMVRVDWLLDDLREVAGVPVA